MEYFSIVLVFLVKNHSPYTTVIHGNPSLPQIHPFYMKFHQHFPLIWQYIMLHSLQMHFVCFSSYFLTFDPTTFLHQNLHPNNNNRLLIFDLICHPHSPQNEIILTRYSFDIFIERLKYNMHTSSVYYCSIIISLLPINNIIYRIFVTFFSWIMFLELLWIEWNEGIIRLLYSRNWREKKVEEILIPFVFIVLFNIIITIFK